MANVAASKTNVAAVKEFFGKGKGKRAQKAVDEVLKKGNGANNSDPEAAQILYTGEYGHFRWLKGNRPIGPAHVAQLVRSMKEHDVPVPIIVNEKFEVIDGQHRLEAHRELLTPVAYIVVPGLDITDVVRLNSTSKSWATENYTHLFIEQGNENYITYAKFKNKYELPHEACILLLAGRGSRSAVKAFREGNFKANDLEGAKKLAEILLTKIKPRWQKGWKDATFIKALYVAKDRIGWNMERFLSSFEENAGMANIYRSSDQYLLMIEDIFNAPVAGTYRKKVAIRHGVDAPKELPPDRESGRSFGAMSDATRKGWADKGKPKAKRKREVVVIKKGAVK